MGGALPPLAAVPASEGSFVLQYLRRTFTASMSVSSSEAGADSSALSNGFAVAAFANCLSALTRLFCCTRSAEQRGAAAEDGQASGGMIKREFSMRT